MSFCPNCGYSVPDGINVCPNCGTIVGQAAQKNAMSSYGYSANPADHTAEFSPSDISENKVIALAAYLLGWIGIIIAFLAAPTSKFAAFHSRQSLKLEIASTLAWIVTALTCWLVIPIFLGAIALAAIFVIRIICFFQVCKGKAVEAPIIRSLGFLK